MSGFVHLWLMAFVWTLALELPVYVAVLHRHLARWWAPVLLTLALNTLTHPALWFLAPTWEPFWSWLLVWETVVALVESTAVWWVLKALGSPVSARRALVAGFTANFTSVTLGFLLLG
ncbi:hypothetical protein NR798_46840 [Archangium gephyra]|uniref:hypothetical protein n=1 Tax=Archangium gephyra TaxID=48 RepID=UPI0035D415BA